MNQWDEAARRASFDVRTEYAPLLGTYGVVISEKSAQKMTEIIAKHFTDLRETYEKLVELAVMMDKVISQVDTILEYSRNQGEIIRLVDNPQVQSAIERSKG